MIKQQIRIPHSKSSVKGYNIDCLVCGYNFNNQEANINRGDMCPLCSNHRVVAGVNDLWTTAPYIAQYLTNSEDGYKFAKYSNKSVDMTCPICRTHIGTKTICHVTVSGISCPCCGDNISFPNKFMYNLLLELGEEFKTEVGHDWCIFPSYNDKDIMSHGRFDFLLPKRKILIEMDSSLGHGKQLYTNSSKNLEETIYRDNQKDRVAKSLGYKVVRIDCSYRDINQRLQACIDGVKNSSLSDIFDFSNISWNEIFKKSFSSFVVQACELYNQGLSSSEIADILHKNPTTIIDYLHQGNDCGLCNFIPQKQRRRQIV